MPDLPAGGQRPIDRVVVCGATILGRSMFLVEEPVVAVVPLFATVAVLVELALPLKVSFLVHRAPTTCRVDSPVQAVELRQVMALNPDRRIGFRVGVCLDVLFRLHTRQTELRFEAHKEQGLEGGAPCQ